MPNFKKVALNFIAFLRKERVQDFLDTLSVAFVGAVLSPFLLFFLIFVAIILKLFPERNFLPLLDSWWSLFLPLIPAFLGAKLAFFIFRARKNGSFLKKGFLYILSWFLLTIYLFGILSALFLLIVSSEIGAFLLFFSFLLLVYLFFRGIRSFMGIFMSKKWAILTLSFIFCVLFFVFSPFLLFEALSSLTLYSHTNILREMLEEIILSGEGMMVIIIPFFLSLQALLIAFSFTLGKLLCEYFKNIVFKRNGGNNYHNHL